MRPTPPAQHSMSKHRRRRRFFNNTFLSSKSILQCSLRLFVLVLGLFSVALHCTLPSISDRPSHVEAGGRETKATVAANNVVHPAELPSPNHPSQKNWPESGIVNNGKSMAKSMEQGPILSSAEPPTVLIVGGSDGSGTRGFVEALGHLGVPMLVDDPISLDVHGKAMFHSDGWPSLVNLIMNYTHSADYSWLRQVPHKVREHAGHEWRHVQKGWQQRVTAMNAAFSNDGSNPRNVSTSVQFGFKAPVSMLVLPLMSHHYGTHHVKFLHVVRDGRDVAVSANKSPVDKFYNVYYKNYLEKRAHAKGNRELLAMDLWNDWNVQVADWCARSPLLEALVVRTEDLIHRKYETLQQLAAFVGSTHSHDQLCCLAHKEWRDLGASVDIKGPRRLEHHGGTEKGMLVRRKLTQKKHRNVVHHQQAHYTDVDDTTLEVVLTQKKRYGMKKLATRKGSIASRFGKWKTVLQSNQSLLQQLEEHGHEGLRRFGYKPPSDHIHKDGWKKLDYPPCNVPKLELCGAT